MHVRNLSTWALLFVLAVTLVACDSGGSNGDDSSGLRATSYRLAGTPNSQILVSIQTSDGGAATGGSSETTTIGSGGTVTESLNLANDVIGVRITVSAGPATSLELLDEGSAVIDSDSGTSGQLVVENGDVSAFP